MLLWAHAGSGIGRRTDGRTDDRYIDPAPHSMRPMSLAFVHSYICSARGCCVIYSMGSGVLGIRGYTPYTNLGFFGQRMLTSVIINKQGTFRPFATPLCIYPPPFLAIHHCLTLTMTLTHTLILTISLSPVSYTHLTLPTKRIV